MDARKEITRRLFKIVLTVLDMAGSKKFLAAVVSGYTAWETTGNAWLALSPILVYLLAQGVADVGKEKAKVEVNDQTL